MHDIADELKNMIWKYENRGCMNPWKSYIQPSHQKVFYHLLLDNI